MAVTLCDRLEAYFKDRPGRWIDGMELSHIAGCYAWRSRVSDLRKRGMRIENKQMPVFAPGGVTLQRKRSIYRYVPADLLAVAEERGA